VQKFTHFIGIDWSGAKGKRHKGIQVAVAEYGSSASRDSAPRLVKPISGKSNWSRREVADWLSSGAGLDDTARILVGIDAAFGMPHDDKGAYFPHDNVAVDNAEGLWRLIANICNGSEDYFGGPFADHFADYYQQQGGRKGQYYSRRMRLTETRCIETKVGPCESVFNLIGASQVGKSALSTMIMLNDIADQQHVTVWPFAEPADGRICFVEIYAAVFAGLGGHKGKVRDWITLDTILNNLNSAAYTSNEAGLNDDQADALITAAGLRYISDNPEYWHPSELSPKVRQTEGWIFGVK
jgi:hypothetical protein